MVNIEVYKQSLIAELQVLQKELSELGVQNKNVPEDWIATPDDPALAEADENLIADRKEEWISRRGEVSELETRYNNIVRALEKIKASKFGLCEICQGEIEPDRLEVNPAARTCKSHLEAESQLAN